MGVMTPALSARAVDVRAGARRILNALDVDIPQARWTAIVGPNGAGKSTLLRVLAGLGPQASAQHIHLLGQPLLAWPVQHRAQTLAWMGQNEQVSTEMSCYDVVMLGRLPYRAWLASPGPEDHAAVQQALKLAHAQAWQHRTLAQLSGGERQRVLLARALAVQAKVLLMDEPLANLDPPYQTDWLLAVRDLVQQGTTVVSVLHELPIALQADELIIMQSGDVVHQGSPREAAMRQALESVFEHRIQVREIDGIWTALPRWTAVPAFEPTRNFSSHE